MLVQPLTCTRRPALAHTSALATVGNPMVTIAPGIAATARVLAAAMVHDRFQEDMVTPLRAQWFGDVAAISHVGERLANTVDLGLDLWVGVHVGLDPAAHFLVR